ncbi:MAG TPA: hypothetical protein ACFYD2_10100 [Candidatus Avalokitesvara rifleensis]|uniref:hypothetical protein n=1 Tax=Candidatus Avalokitesvara rifleensis TaxID=3367620 RepID=UPI002713ED86|nr:hypothetical protein [Candidatus Brocadiales bacterium]
MSQLKKELAKIDFEDLGKVSFEDIINNITLDPSIAQYKPLSHYQVDPRSGDRVVYSEARAKRPHDNVSVGAEKPAKSKGCVVCEGETTSIIDIASISEGFTFINKNLFPVTYPFGTESLNENLSYNPFARTGRKAVGSHFLHWPSNLHDSDFHNMNQEDALVVFERLCMLEQKLLHSPDSGMTLSHKLPNGDHYGYIGVIKNVGRLVGGSLAHGHHQIMHTNIKPRRVEEDEGFRQNFGQNFSDYILRENPGEYTIKEYGHGVRLLVPYFMRRPLHAMIVVADNSSGYLHHLSKATLNYLCLAVRDVSRAVVGLMPKLDRELAYNWIIHEGDIGGMYVEILPWTQEMGGYEQLGIFLCQNTPETSVKHYRELLL